MSTYTNTDDYTRSWLGLKNAETGTTLELKAGESADVDTDALTDAERESLASDPYLKAVQTKSKPTTTSTSSTPDTATKE